MSAAAKPTTIDLHVRSHVDTAAYGVSGGQYSAPAGRARGPRPMTRAEVAWAQAEGRDMPARFTGRWGGRYFYRGREWTGDTNAIGAGR
jgi:hypothetical protein